MELEYLLFRLTPSLARLLLAGVLVRCCGVRVLIPYQRGRFYPGTGSVKDPATGRWVDDIHLLIGDIEWLDETERDQIFAGNAQALFKL